VFLLKLHNWFQAAGKFLLKNETLEISPFLFAILSHETGYYLAQCERRGQNIKYHDMVVYSNYFEKVIKKKGVYLEKNADESCVNYVGCQM